MKPHALILALLVCAPRISYSEEKPNAEALQKLRKEVVQTYARIAFATYNDSLVAAERMQKKIEEFLATPSEETLAAAKEAWIYARKPYLQSEVLRFCEGPIDVVEGKINSWPIDENYIDYVAEVPDAGVINNPKEFPELSNELIDSLNEKEGEKNISTGFHAIEFLLWGQDQSVDGPGQRSFRDYVIGPDATVPNPERRREYLRLVTQMLINNLREVRQAWTEGDPNNYRTWLLASVERKGLAKMLHGMGALGIIELAGERMTVAYETKEQEDEHSCFSDTTHQDIEYDMVGIRNLYRGEYVCLDGSRVEGPSLYALLQAIDPTLAETLANAIDSSLEAVRAIPAPFDQSIRGKDTAPGRVALHKAIESLQALTDPIEAAMKLLNVRSPNSGGEE